MWAPPWAANVEEPSVTHTARRDARCAAATGTEFFANRGAAMSRFYRVPGIETASGIGAWHDRW